jgi:glycosyltransferase involved in cell wall biosynthesis
MEAVSDLASIEVVEVYPRSNEYQWSQSTEFKFDRTLLLDKTRKLSLYNRVNFILKKSNPDVIFISGWSSPADLFSLFWGVVNSKHVVVMSDSQLNDFKRFKFIELVKSKILSSVSGAFVAGELHKKYIETLGVSSHKVLMGYDVVDNNHFMGQSHKNRKDFIISARLINKKNISFLLHAYKKYLSLYIASSSIDSPWNLIILGDGPLKKCLIKLASQLDIERFVYFEGFVQYPDLPNYYSKAGALLLGSTTEQWGLVVNEAMASGLPIIVSKACGCVPELVFDGVNGFAIDGYDISEWAERMHYISRLSQKDRNNMEASSVNIISKYTPGSHASSILSLCELIIKSPVKKVKIANLFLLFIVANLRIFHIYLRKL